MIKSVFANYLLCLVAYCHLRFLRSDPSTFRLVLQRVASGFFPSLLLVQLFINLIAIIANPTKETINDDENKFPLGPVGYSYKRLASPLVPAVRLGDTDYYLAALLGTHVQVTISGGGTKHLTLAILNYQDIDQASKSIGRCITDWPWAGQTLILFLNAACSS